MHLWRPEVTWCSLVCWTSLNFLFLSVQESKWRQQLFCKKVKENDVVLVKTPEIRSWNARFYCLLQHSSLQTGYPAPVTCHFPMAKVFALLLLCCPRGFNQVQQCLVTIWISCLNMCCHCLTHSVLGTHWTGLLAVRGGGTSQEEPSAPGCRSVRSRFTHGAWP